MRATKEQGSLRKHSNRAFDSGPFESLSFFGKRSKLDDFAIAKGEDIPGMPLAPLRLVFQPEKEEFAGKSGGSTHVVRRFIQRAHDDRRAFAPG